MSSTNFRMLPPPASGGASVLTGGRTVTVTKDTYLDIREEHAARLGGWTSCGAVGSTALRPTNAVGGKHYVDTTLSKVIFADGSGNWRDPFTGGIV